MRLPVTAAGTAMAQNFEQLVINTNAGSALQRNTTQGYQRAQEFRTRGSPGSYILTHLVMEFATANGGG